MSHIQHIYTGKGTTDLHLTILSFSTVSKFLNCWAVLLTHFYVCYTITEQQTVRNSLPANLKQCFPYAKTKTWQFLNSLAM